MRQAKQVYGTLAIFEQGLHRGIGAVLCRKIAEEGITGAEGKKAKRDAGTCSCVGEDAVEDFVGRAVAADGDKTAIVLRVRFAGEVRGVAGARGGNHVNVQAVLAQACDERSGEFCGAAAAGCGIHDGEEGFSHEGAASYRSQRTKIKPLLSG